MQPLQSAGNNAAVAKRGKSCNRCEAREIMQLLQNVGYHATSAIRGKTRLVCVMYQQAIEPWWRSSKRVRAEVKPTCFCKIIFLHNWLTHHLPPHEVSRLFSWSDTCPWLYSSVWRDWDRKTASQTTLRKSTFMISVCSIHNRISMQSCPFDLASMRGRPRKRRKRDREITWDSEIYSFSVECRKVKDEIISEG